jgi:hypothetical protein
VQDRNEALDKTLDPLKSFVGPEHWHMDACDMSRVKQPKRKRLIKAAGAGSRRCRTGAFPGGERIRSSDCGPSAIHEHHTHQSFVLDEEEMADVSLATFHVFDKENGTQGFTKVAYGCGPALHVAVALAAVPAEAAVGTAAVYGGCCASWAPAVIVDSMNAEISFHNPRRTS